LSSEKKKETYSCTFVNIKVINTERRRNAVEVEESSRDVTTSVSKTSSDMEPCCLNENLIFWSSVELVISYLNRYCSKNATVLALMAI